MEVKKSAEKLTELMKKDKFRYAVIAVGVLGILLIYLSGFFSSSQKEEAPKEASQSVMTADEYEKKLEERLVKIVSAITGEPSPAVMVTLETMGKSVYARDETHKTDESAEYEDGRKVQSQSKEEKENEYVMTKDAQGNQQMIKVSEIQPEIKGVVIVSQNAEDVFTQEKIIHAVKTAMNLSSSKICVVHAK